MAFSHIIAHQLSRPAPTAPLQWQARQEPFALNGKIEEVLRELKHTYIKKSGKAYGRFSSDLAARPFSQWLSEYRREKLSFASLTQTALQHLKLEIEKTECPLHAQLFFAQEILEGDQYLYVFVVFNAAGVYLDGNLEISDSVALDTQGINLAARIHLNGWEAGGSTNYLSLLRWRGEKELSDAFANFLGFCDKVDAKAQTQELLEIVDQFARELDAESASFTRHTLVDYCLEQAKQDKPVVIQELAAHVHHERPAAFTDFVKSQQVKFDDEFIADTSALRQYVRLSGRNELLSMSFTADCLGSSIQYDPENDSLIINAIPPALKARLLKHLKGKA